MAVMTKPRVQLFLTAMFQVMFVSMNVVFISKGMLTALLLTGFMISLMWTLNVKRIAIGGWGDRILYSTGAMIGTGIGYFLSNFIIKLL